MEAFPSLNSNLRLCAVSGFAALSAFFSVTDNAQAPEPSTQLAEVVVTAEYREEKLQDTPIAISAITAQDIEQRSFSDSFEVGYTVPNASFRPAQAAFGNTMTAFIRGVGQYDFDFAFEPGVGVYVDDVYQPFTMGTQMDLMDMDRV
ncbi:MAG: TonB-dependent receptor, partial [Gammaproteobacteria bacterium]